MGKYLLVPYIPHRDPVIKLGKKFDKIRDNMISFLSESFAFPDDYDDRHIAICNRIMDYDYNNSIEELITDFEKVCTGYAIVNQDSL